MKGKDIYLENLTVTDIEHLLVLECKNRTFLKKTSPAKPESFFTLEGQKQRIENSLTCRANDLGYSYGIYLQNTKQLIGTIDLFQVERGPLQCAWLGYGIDYDYLNKGYATQAVKEILQIAFKDLKLHRIMAGAMPHNLASIRVLEKNGFKNEGLSMKNVKINGKWEDHYAFAIINPHDE